MFYDNNIILICKKKTYKKKFDKIYKKPRKKKKT